MGTTYNSSTSGSTSTTTSSTQSGSTSKTYASGTVDEKTKKNKDKYSNAYQQSNVVNQAYQQLQNLQQPGMFSSQYEEQMNKLYEQFVNRDDFEFDVNESVLYEQLKDQYASLGKLAMADTMGQAASMTGGYGSSYANTVGQQAYQNYMQQLQEQIPSLYQMEMEKYNQEGENMLNQYNLAKNMYDTDYGEHRDAMSDYYTNRDYYNALYQDERAFDYNQYQADRDYWTNEYWNEKNAETTTDTSSWEESTSTTDSSSWSNSSSTSSGSSSSDKKSEGGSYGGTQTPLSNDYANQVLNTAMNKGSRSKAEKYVEDLYASGKISESNFNYFLDQIEDNFKVKGLTKGMFSY